MSLALISKQQRFPWLNMSREDAPKTPGEHILQQVEALRPLAKVIGFFNPDLGGKFQDVEKQVETVKQMIANRDLFARVYSPLGWVNYDRLSTDIVAQALEMSVDDGEIALTNYHLNSDNLRFLGYRFGASHYEPWAAIYERAVERTNAEDYLSAIPLLLIIIDGICTTSTGKHPFSGGADAPVFDSQTSGPGGLPEGLALLGSMRRKLDTEAIPAPFRHGILHGLNPNFGSPVVAAKAYNLLQAMVDYFDRRRDEAQRMAKAKEDQKPVDLYTLGRNLLKNAEMRRAFEEWQARPTIKDSQIASSDVLPDLPVDSPEEFAAEYLSLLVNRNFGGLAKVTVDYPNRTIGYRAGRLREELKDITVTRWTITGAEDTTAATSRIMTRLEGLIDGESWSGEQPMQLTFADENHHALVRGLAGGIWMVMPNFLVGLSLLAARSTRNAS